MGISFLKKRLFTHVIKSSCVQKALINLFLKIYIEQFNKTGMEFINVHHKYLSLAEY